MKVYFKLISSTAILLFLFTLSLASNTSGGTPNDTELPSFARGRFPVKSTTHSARKAQKVRPDTEYPSLDLGGFVTDQLSSLPNNEFVERLRLATRTENDRSVYKNIKPRQSMVKSLLFSSALLLLAVSLLSPTKSLQLTSEIWDAVISVLSVSWLPFMWLRRPIKETIVESLIYFKVLCQPEVFEFFHDKVIPKTLATFRKMLVAELWGRFWIIATDQVQSMFGTSSSTASTTDPTQKSTAVWLIDEGHKFLVGTVQRGAKKIIQSTVQNHLQASLWSLFRFGTDTLRSQSVLLFDSTINSGQP